MNEKLHEIFDLCLRLNPVQTKQELTGNKPTVFFWFSGHTNDIEVSIYEKGWIKNVSNDVWYRIKDDSVNTYYPSRDDYEDHFTDTIDDVISHLRRLCNEWEDK